MRKDIRKSGKVSISLLAALSLSAATFTVSAADQDSDEQEKETGYQQSSVLEEVITTAQKREQSIQDVSVAVTAFTGDALEKLGLQEGLDITQQVPNMNFFAIFGEASSPSMTLRGVGLSNFADTWEAPVGLYIDEVYRGNPAGSGMQLFDVERIEVLRGPQGTLFGRNTTAGLVHHITKNPTDELEAKASLQVGSFSELIFEGVVSGGFSDSVRGRFAFKKNDSDGWQTNGVDGRDLGTTDTFGYRGKLDIDLSDTVNLLLDIHGSEADQQTVGFVNLGYQDPANTAERCSVARILNGECISVTIPGARISREEAGGWGPKHVSSGAADGIKTEIDTFGVSGKLHIETDSFDITSITAYETMDKFLEDDFDATAVIWFDEQYGADTEQFSQEIRLNGDTDTMRWVAGVYYFTDERDLFTQGPTADDAAAFGGFWHNEFINQETESLAVFGQIDRDLSDTLTLIAGARYTWEEKDADFDDRGLSSYYNGYGTGPFVSLSDKLDESGFSGRLGLDYKPDDETLYYASVSRGLKSGGFNGSYVPGVGAFGPVTKETMTSFEAGYKADIADGRGRLNIAAFIYEYEDFQAQLWDSSIGAADITNLGDVSGYGLEAELVFQATDNLELIAGLGLLSTEIDSDLNTNVAGMDIPIDGNEMPSAPGITANMVARYYAGNFTYQFDYTWQDDHELQLENDPWSKQDSYGIANAKISWASDTGSWVVSGAVNNLFDEEYFTYLNTGGSDWGYGVWGAPLTWNVKIAYMFQ